MRLSGMTIVVFFAASVLANAEDPGLPDSVCFGNLDGGPVISTVNSILIFPVWVKTDDSVAFAVISFAALSGYISSSDYINPFYPLNLWDEDFLLDPIPDYPQPGYTTYEFIAWANTHVDPPFNPPIMTNYEWVKIAEFIMHASADSAILGDTIATTAGFDPVNGPLHFGLSDGFTEFLPDAVYGSIFFAPDVCVFLPGDANGNGIYNGVDATYSINYLKGLGNEPPCSCDCGLFGPIYSAADANGSCSFNGVDVTYSINYLKGYGPAPTSCAECQPVYR